MSHKLSELQEGLTARRRGRGRDAHYVADCPLCGYSHSVDVRASEASAEVLAKQNVIRHMRAQHEAEIDINA